jgi:thymidylate synthase
MEIRTRNVNSAFKTLVEGIYSGKIPHDVSPSRYGEVIVIPEPVLIHYEKPLERVLFNEARDANPFANLYESLYMLAGRNDVAPLAYYTSRMKEFSDDGKTLNGAYGYRWRHAKYGVGQKGNKFYGGTIEDRRPEVDQLKVLINHLKTNPYSRRAVLQMWKVEDDLLKIDDGPDRPHSGDAPDREISKDVCCNLSVMFSVEMGSCRACNGSGYQYDSCLKFPIPQTCIQCNGQPHDRPRYLNMTVTNRSNDLIWGLLGANYSTFSVLQEYVAAHLGLEVGRYCHFTNNLHAYTERWEPEKWIAADRWSVTYELGNAPDPGNPTTDLWKSVPLVSDPVRFDSELPEFIEDYSGKEPFTETIRRWDEPFIDLVARPMLLAFRCHKAKAIGMCLSWINQIEADDWRIAAGNWINRRIAKRMKSST